MRATKQADVSDHDTEPFHYLVRAIVRYFFTWSGMNSLNHNPNHNEIVVDVGDHGARLIVARSSNDFALLLARSRSLPQSNSALPRRLNHTPNRGDDASRSAGRTPSETGERVVEKQGEGRSVKGEFRALIRILFCG
jgi:hypothetical protein